MTNKSTKKALLLSVLAMLMCVAMLVGTTFAWFTDSVTSGRNVIKAGNLDVVLEYWDGDSYEAVDGNTKLFDDAALWEPGHTEVAYLKVSNAGTLALKYQLSVNVYEEIKGINVAGEEFKLSDHLVFSVVDKEITSDADLYTRETAIAAAGDAKGLETYLSPETSLMATGEADYVALIIYMPTTVGNEANYKTGTAVPSITMGVNLVATQEVNEDDFFDNTYDKDATYPTYAIGYTTVDEDAPYQEIYAYNPKGGKVGFARVPAEAIADGVTELKYTVFPTKLDESVTITSDQDAKSYDVKITGIKDGNTEDIEIIFEVGLGLTGVELYHKNNIVNGAVYDANTGDIRFFTDSFSPFTIVFDAVPQEKPNLPEDAPVAIVEALGASTDIVWERLGGFYPSNPEQQLDTVYSFKAPHNSETVQDSKYEEWYCDYYVRLETDKMEKLPEGYITLGGSYGEWGWIGFDNPEVDTNTDIPLLGSVTQNPWTYEAVVSFVEEFKCGVGLAVNEDGTAVAGDKLDGAKFVVMLRLTNPENEAEYYNVNTIEYIF